MGDRRRRGEGHPNSKLTWEVVDAIRASKESDSALARKHGVARATVRLVRENVTWHDPDYDPRPSPFPHGRKGKSANEAAATDA